MKEILIGAAVSLVISFATTRIYLDITMSRLIRKIEAANRDFLAETKKITLKALKASGDKIKPKGI